MEKPLTSFVPAAAVAAVPGKFDYAAFVAWKPQLRAAVIVGSRLELKPPGSHHLDHRFELTLPAVA